MRAGWNPRLADAVQRKDPLAQLIAEVVAIADEHVKVSRTDWTAGSDGGDTLYPTQGGARLSPSSTGVVSTGPDDGAQVTALNRYAPFDAVIIEWTANGAENQELADITLRLDPRADGGQPKTAAFFWAQLFRIAEFGGEGLDLVLEPRTRPVRVAATGEVEDDFVFDFSGTVGRATVGPPPVGITQRRPFTVVKVWAVQADGETPADNVAWMADAAEGSEASGSGYTATHYGFIPAPAGTGTETFVTRGPTVANMPEFSLNRSSYTADTVTFDQPSSDIDDLTGTGDLVIVARAELPGDSDADYFIWDGSAYVECFDGDVVGEDNTAQGGADLSGVPTTGPWDAKVDLIPSTDGFQTPWVRAFGIQRVVRTPLVGEAEIHGGHVQVDPFALKANIPRADVDILKKGERDYLDIGSEILALHHIGQIHVRVWVGDPTGAHLDRRDWMLHSVWDVDDYRNLSDRHRLECISPLRRLSAATVPPFVSTGGNDGTRTPVDFADTRAAVYDDLLDTYAALPGRLIGSVVEDTTNSVAKTVTKSDVKALVDEIAYLGGQTVTEFQGRIHVVDVVRDELGDVAKAFFPIGSYTIPEGGIGPGFTARTDEFFVRYNYSLERDRFEDERRYFDATAFAKLGGAGLNTTQTLADEIAKWITTEALADAIGRRVMKHFVNGEILWPILPHERNPQLTLGDVVVAQTDRFVGRSPITDQEIRGPVTVFAIVVQVGEFWGQDLLLWVPSWDYIVPGEGTVTPSGFGVPMTRRFAPEEFGSASGPLQPSGTGSPEEFFAVVDIPVGSVITAISSRAARQNAGDEVAVALFGKWQYLGSPIGSVLLDALLSPQITHSVDADDWTVEQAAIADVEVTSTGPDRIGVRLEAASSVADARLAWVEIDYVAPLTGRLA